MGGKLNTLTQICTQMIVSCNQLVCMLMVDDATNILEASTLKTFSSEHNIIPSRIHQYSQIYKNWDDNRLPCQQYVTRCLFPVTNVCILHMVIVQVESNNCEASTLRTVSREYNIILQNTPIFSNLHRIGGK
jgi:hypothetical protein